MERRFFTIAALMGLAAVALGAFGAHGLQSLLQKRYISEPALAQRMLDNWETAARYHMYHALALFAVAYACARWPASSARVAGWMMFGGTLIFSGTLYVLVLTDARWLGAITPIGGVALMVGWGLLAWSAWKSPKLGTPES